MTSEVFGVLTSLATWSPMADRSIVAPTAQTDAPESRTVGVVGRTIGPRKGLPGTRSVVGGLLVAVAALGTWLLATDAGAEEGTRYVVASRAVGPGERLSDADLAWARLDLPDDQRAHAFSDARELEGTVALGPIAPGELLQAGAIGPAAGTPEEREVSFAVDADWAVAGRLRSGDRIDVFATDSTGDDAASARVLADATIRRIDDTESDGFGDGNRQIITVGVRSGDDDVAPLITAARNGDLTVLRSTGSSPQERNGS